MGGQSVNGGDSWGDIDIMVEDLTLIDYIINRKYCYCYCCYCNVIDSTLVIHLLLLQYFN